MPIIQKRIHRVLYWRSADQPLDFTTKDDVAAYTAAAALDEAAPRILRDMFSGAGKLHPLDNERYPGLLRTRVNDHLSKLGPW